VSLALPWFAFAESQSANVTPHEVAHQKRQAAMVADLMDADDAGVTELGGAACLAEEAVPLLAAGETPRPRHLHRHPAIQLGVAGLIHGPESAAAHQVNKLESP
jgi:hypothetical protein